MVSGIDAHTRTHTIVAVDERGRQVAQRTINATTADHLGLVIWAETLHAADRLWAIEACRHLSRRLERDLQGAGERVVRVPTKMMAGTRKASSDCGKSDPIDALADAGPPSKNPTCPPLTSTDRPETSGCSSITAKTSSPNGPGSSTGCASTSTNSIPHPTWDPPARSLDRAKTAIQMNAHLADLHGTVARLACRFLERCTTLTVEIKQLEGEIAELVTPITRATASAASGTSSSTAPST